MERAVVPWLLLQPGLLLGASGQGPGAPHSNPNLILPPPGLLLHDVTMAGLQELRFPEEKPLLRGLDAAELVSRPLAVLGRRAPPRGQEGNRVCLLRSCPR